MKGRDHSKVNLNWFNCNLKLMLISRKAIYIFIGIKIFAFRF